MRLAVRCSAGQHCIAANQWRWRLPFTVRVHCSSGESAQALWPTELCVPLQRALPPLTLVRHVWLGQVCAHLPLAPVPSAAAAVILLAAAQQAGHHPT